MNKNLLIGIVVLLLLVGGYFLFANQQDEQMTDTSETDSLQQQVPGDSTTNGEDTEDSMTRQQMTVLLNQQNDSGETGSATLVEENGQVVVSLDMQGSPEDTPQPAHIHTGECPDVGGITHPLTNVENGVSVTTLDTTLADLESQLPLAINVHKSVPEASVYTACGDIIF